MNRRRLLTPTNYIYLTYIKLIYNEIGARRKRGRYGEDGGEHEHKCEGTGDSEVHVCIIETECFSYWIIHRVRKVQYMDKL